MSSETISVLVGIGCLFLAIAYYLFAPQVLLFLKHLARIEFRSLENQQIKTARIASRDTKPWTWDKALITALIHPNDDTGKELTSDGNISFKRACIWIIVTSIVSQYCYSIILWMRFPTPINLNSISIVLRNSLLASVFIPISILTSTGFIHGIAKIFGKKGTFQNFFIISVVFNAPILLISYLLALITRFIPNNFLLFLGIALSFYLFLVVNTKAIKANYHFHWLSAFLINLFVQIIFFILGFALTIMVNPNIIKQ